MVDQRDDAPKGDHVADDAAGKGIQARVNTPSDPHTKGTEQADDDLSQADEASASGDLAAVKAADGLKDSDQTVDEGADR
jgi:hypothetical protein